MVGWWGGGDGAGSSDTRTGANHCDGRLDVDPLVRVDAGVDEDEAVEVGLLHSAQRVLDGVVVLKGTPGIMRNKGTRHQYRYLK